MLNTNPIWPILQENQQRLSDQLKYLDNELALRFQLQQRLADEINELHFHRGPVVESLAMVEKQLSNAVVTHTR